MRKYLIVVAIVGALATFAHAQVFPWIEEGTREFLLEGDWDPKGTTGTEIELSAGYGFFLRDLFEVGGLLSYASYEDAGGPGVDSKSWGLSGFAEYHFDVLNAALPYVGARIGYVDTEEASWDKTAFVYGPRAGIKYFIADNIAIDAALEYMFATEDIFTNEGEHEDSDLSLKFGIRTMF